MISAKKSIVACECQKLEGKSIKPEKEEHLPKASFLQKYRIIYTEGSHFLASHLQTSVLANLVLANLPARWRLVMRVPRIDVPKARELEHFNAYGHAYVVSLPVVHSETT